MSTTPAVTAIVSIFLVKDEVTWKKLAALALAIAGVLILQLKAQQSGGNHPWLGVLLIFAAVCCEAGYTLMGEALTKIIRQRRYLDLQLR